MKNVRIIGSGLIGTSIGLALSGSDCAIEMLDKDFSRSALAQSLVGSLPTGDPSLIILAVPTSALSEVIAAQYQLNPKSTFIDIASTKTKSQEIADSFPAFSERFCATHPMAGREIAGPESARADLFQGRPWIYS
ncbi:MAG: prephenate dehydrogenase/arogenate dehydrogenase family protein, partial [Actinobacteria bacterium]|nr:prephenate dehydrogenase/arogenate dehydrogenase family protein [Actinomycetota bacterium]